MLTIGSLRGKISHPRFGETSYLGFDTELFEEESRAGRRYLQREDIRPYEFFCKFKDKLYDFRYTEKRVFDEAGHVKCGINVKKNSIINLYQAKGGTEYYTEFVDLDKSISRIPRYISNSETRIENRIINMNRKNRKLVESKIALAIVKKAEDIKMSKLVDNDFPFRFSYTKETLTRDGIEVCGRLVESEGKSKADVILRKIKATYKRNSLSKELNPRVRLKTQLNFVEEKDQCFPITDKSYIQERFLNAVLFYEP